MSLDGYLDKWLEMAAKPKLRAETHHDYEALLKRYVRPTLGSRRLRRSNLWITRAVCGHASFFQEIPRLLRIQNLNFPFACFGRSTLRAGFCGMNFHFTAC